MASTLSEQLGIEEIGPDEFMSISNAARLGNARPIGYGGGTMGIGIHAAARTVKPEYNLYSVLGHFLGPASTDRKLRCCVDRVRDTRTFATRSVKVSQVLASGEERVCMLLVADFHVLEPAMMAYSAAPLARYSDVDQCPTAEELAEDLIAKGHISKIAADAQNAGGAVMASYFENRLCPEGIWGQSLAGLAKHIPTTQDHLPITSKTSGDWFRVAQPLSSKDEHLAALAFMMDAGPSFMPLIHDHKGFGDAAAASTLDFALRIFVSDVDVGGWHLRERMTHTAGVGRNYSESKLWSHDGTMVASMTQQCILRANLPLSASL